MRRLRFPIFALHRAVILEKVCKYLYHKVQYTNCTAETPDFIIEPEIALELLMASDFLDV